MLRFKILASAIPLAVTAFLARGEMLPGTRPCIEISGTSVQIAAFAWQAQQHVSFTDNPALANARVRLTDRSDDADFVVIDDTDTAEAGACEAGTVPQLIAISADPAGSEAIIYLSPDGPADYRIFVRSRTFSARDAAALIVGARGRPARLAAASL